MRKRLRKKKREQGQRLRDYYEANHIPYYIEECSVFKKKHWFRMNRIHAAVERASVP